MPNSEAPAIIFIDSAGFSSSYRGKALSSGGPVYADSARRFVSPYSGEFRGYSRNDEGYAYIYMTSVWAFRGLSMRAQKVAELVQGSKLVDKMSGKPVLVRNTLLDQALEKAFLYYYQDVYDEWSFFKYLTGKAFIELVEMPIPNTIVSFPSG